MARKKKEEKTPEQLAEESLLRDLKDLTNKLYLIPYPVKPLSIGDQVTIGALENVIVQEVLEDGRIILINFSRTNTNYGRPYTTKNQKMYVKWTDVRLVNENQESLIRNEDLRLYYSSRQMSDIFSKAYYFGIDFEPDYQRDYVWELNDKIELIDSIFNNVDIGKFVFVRIEDKKWKDSGYKYSYEILDGKQRIRAILDYFEDKFSYKGKLFSELNVRDQDYFESYHINIAEMDRVTEEHALRYFLKLNVTGKTMDKVHLDKVKERLDNLK